MVLLELLLHLVAVVAVVAVVGFHVTWVVIVVGEARAAGGVKPCALYVLRVVGCCQYLGISNDPERRDREHRAKARQHGRGRWKQAVDGQTFIRWCGSEDQARKVERRMILAFRWTTIAGRCFLFLPRRWVGNSVFNRATRGPEVWQVPLWVAWYSWRALVGRRVARGRPDRVTGMVVDAGFVRPWEPRGPAQPSPDEVVKAAQADLFKVLGINDKVGAR